jgi:hypothetical protein
LNNPISFVNSNLGTLAEYVKEIKKLLEKYEKMERIMKVENPALRQAQGGERSRTTEGGG